MSVLRYCVNIVTCLKHIYEFYLRFCIVLLVSDDCGIVQSWKSGLDWITDIPSYFLSPESFYIEKNFGMKYINLTE